MKTVLIATEKPFAEDARCAASETMKKAGLNVEILEKYENKEELIKALEGVHGLIVRSDKILKDVIDAAPDLKVIVRGGAGYNTIDIDYAAEKGIVVENTPGTNSNAVAELAIQFIMRAIRPLNGKGGRELKGKKLGVHGFGKIGQKVAKLAKAFGMEVQVYDIMLNEKAIEDCGVTAARTIEELWAGKQFMSLHIPSNDKTKKSINYNLLNLMTDDGLLINTARADIVNEDELNKILKEKINFKYATDVAPENKGIIEEHGEKVIATPKKQGAQTAEANYDTACQAAKQCVEYFINNNTLNQVNK